jgi:hypothetical protein
MVLLRAKKHMGLTSSSGQAGSSLSCLPVASKKISSLSTQKEATYDSPLSPHPALLRLNAGTEFEHHSPRREAARDVLSVTVPSPRFHPPLMCSLCPRIYTTYAREEAPQEIASGLSRRVRRATWREAVWTRA